jgi:hypothetical protein
MGAAVLRSDGVGHGRAPFNVVVAHGPGPAPDLPTVLPCRGDGWCAAEHPLLPQLCMRYVLQGRALSCHLPVTVFRRPPPRLPIVTKKAPAWRAGAAPDALGRVRNGTRLPSCRFKARVHPPQCGGPAVLSKSRASRTVEPHGTPRRFSTLLTRLQAPQIIRGVTHQYTGKHTFAQATQPAARGFPWPGDQEKV